MCTPNWGPGPQPRHVPWLGIKLATFLFAGQRSVHWATPARATPTFLIPPTQTTYRRISPAQAGFSSFALLYQCSAWHLVLETSIMPQNQNVESQTLFAFLSHVHIQTQNKTNLIVSQYSLSQPSILLYRSPEVIFVTSLSLTFTGNFWCVWRLRVPV